MLCLPPILCSPQAHSHVVVTEYKDGVEADGLVTPSLPTNIATHHEGEHQQYEYYVGWDRSKLFDAP